MASDVHRYAAFLQNPPVCGAQPQGVALGWYAEPRWGGKQRIFFPDVQGEVSRMANPCHRIDTYVVGHPNTASSRYHFLSSFRATHVSP